MVAAAAVAVAVAAVVACGGRFCWLLAVLAAAGYQRQKPRWWLLPVVAYCAAESPGKAPGLDERSRKPRELCYRGFPLVFSGCR